MFSFLTIHFSSKAALAGLGSFTELDRINGWLIERKVDLRTNKTRCRASIENTGTWFSDRIRLNEKNEDELIIPTKHLSNKRINKMSLVPITDALKRCRSNLVYFIDNE